MIPTGDTLTGCSDDEGRRNTGRPLSSHNGAGGGAGGVLVQDIPAVHPGRRSRCFARWTRIRQNWVKSSAKAGKRCVTRGFGEAVPAGIDPLTAAGAS